jgi:hypothetical protein
LALKTVSTWWSKRSRTALVIIARLTQIKGVGRWTVEMLLIFSLGRPDVLPVDDYGIRQGFAIAYRKRKLPEPEQTLKHGERWRPYRTTASWYLWRAVDLRDDGQARRRKRRTAGSPMSAASDQAWFIWNSFSWVCRTC